MGVGGYSNSPICRPLEGYRLPEKDGTRPGPVVPPLGWSGPLFLRGNILKQKLKFERKGTTIRDLEANVKESFPSIAAAKKRSAKIQRDAGGLGCGILRTVK
jgi:hypothetical protein